MATLDIEIKAALRRAFLLPSLILALEVCILVLLNVVVVPRMVAAYDSMRMGLPFTLQHFYSLEIAAAGLIGLTALLLFARRRRRIAARQN